MSALVENSEVKWPVLCERISITKNDLFFALDYLDREQYMANIKFARGNGKIMVPFYDRVDITEKGMKFMKRIKQNESSGSKNEQALENRNTLPAVFVSYNRGCGKFVDRLETSLMGLAKIQRDKTGIKTWCSITEFMKFIRKQDFAVLVISDEYLKSTACLFEVVQLMKDDGWNDKTMYVVMDDARGLYNPLKQADYIEYWNDHCKDLEKRISTLPAASTAKLSEELKKSTTILLNIGEFMAMVADANNPSVDKAISEIQNKVKVNDNVILTSPITPMRAKASLSKEATSLLLCACEDKNGIILATRTLSGLSVNTNGKDFVSSHEPREEARWESAIEELQRRGFIKAADYKNEVFRVTIAGFDATDQLKN